MPADLDSLEKELQSLKNPEKVRVCKRFFKTGVGEYGEGDEFLGLTITVPARRALAKKYLHLRLDDIQKLLNSEFHEYRQVGLFILVYKFPKAVDEVKKEIYDFYLANTQNINNWDLVDSSARQIVGDFLFAKSPKEKRILYKLAHSNNLWERRIAMISTFDFIMRDKFDEALDIAEVLVDDTHDLIHKAVGWMLREIGKRDQAAEEEFLEKHHKTMPRTMLRYALEKFDQKKKDYYMGRTPFTIL